MDLEPCTDIDLINRVVNDPTVRPMLGGGTEYFDMKQAFDLMPGSVALMNETGGFVFYRIMDGLFSIHCMFLPEGRGAKAVRAAMQAVSWMFENAEARAICTEIPVCNPSAMWLARRTGFQNVGRREGSYMAPDGSIHDMNEFLLTKPQWEAGRNKGVASCLQ
jgi:hypothetical protein